MLKSMKLWTIIVTAFVAVGVMAAPTMTGDANYTAGTDYTFTITLGSYDTGVNGVGIDLTLPDTWGEVTATIVPATTSATTGLASAFNATNDSLAIGWFKAQGALPGAAEVLTVTVDVPAGQTGAKTISLKVIYGDTVDTSQILNIAPQLPGQIDIYLTKSDKTQVHKWVMNGSTIVSDDLVYDGDGSEVLALQGDLNGDGITDLIWKTTATNAVRADLMNADATVATTGSLYPGGTWTISQIGDLNGDGKDDLVWYDTNTKSLAAWLMNGLTKTEEGLLHDGSIDPNWTISAIGDMNGDGKDDLVWENSVSGSVYGFIMNGLTKTSQGLLHDGVYGSSWRVAGAGDTNGDGKDDLMWNNISTGSVYGFIMDGLTKTSQGLLHDGAIDSNWAISQIGDMNGDDKADLLWTNSATGQVYGYIMNGLSKVSQGSVLNAGTTWKVGQLADVNDDGKDDIIWNNISTKVVHVFIMNGLSVSESTQIDNGSSDLTSTVNPL